MATFLRCRALGGTIPQTGEDDLKVDDAMMMFFSTILAFDHARQQILIISNAFIDESAPQLEAKYQKAVAEIDALELCSTNPWQFPIWEGDGGQRAHSIEFFEGGISCRSR